MADSYNGWANKETWLVHLWLTNDQASESMWRSVAAEVSDRYRLADILRCELEGSATDLHSTGLYADLLTTALGRVNWDDVARHLLE